MLTPADIWAGRRSGNVREPALSHTMSATVSDSSAAPAVPLFRLFEAIVDLLGGKLVQPKDSFDRLFYSM